MKKWSNSLPKKIAIFLLVVILFFSIVVRTVGLFSNNVLFLYDGARDFLYVQKIVVDHKPILMGPSTGLQGFYQGVIWYYLLAIPFAISGGDPISGTWFMIIGSLISVFAAFFILRKTMNTTAGIFGAMFLGLGDYSIATSKFLWNPYPIVWLMPFYFLGIWLICQKKISGLLLVSFVWGLILSFEVVYGVAISPAYLLLFFLGIYRLKKWDKVKYVLLALFFVALPLFSSLFFDMRHDFMMTKVIIKTLETGGANITHGPGEIENSLVTRLSLRFADLIAFTIQSVTKNTLVNYGLFFCLIGGVFIMMKELRKKQEVLLILTITVLISPFFVLLLFKYSVWANYWTGTAAMYGMFLAFVIGYLVEKYRKHWYAIVLILFLLVIAKPWSILPIWYKGELEPGAQTLPTQLAVVKTIYADAASQKFSVYQHTPPVYDYIYRYLFSWQGMKNYNYVPTNEKQPLVYVILEGVRSDPQGTFFKDHTLHLTSQPVKVIRFENDSPVVEKFETKVTDDPVDPNLFPQL